jgi:predicted small metal-binding protein
MRDPERIRVSCQCGWNSEGLEDEVVQETQEHVLKVHWTEASREDVLDMATPI